MKIILIRIMQAALAVLYAPMKLLKAKNRIVYLSRQSDDKSVDMLLLERAVSELSPDTKQVFRLRTIPDGLLPKLGYAFSILGDMFYLATSKVAILDTYSIPVSCLRHKKCLKVVQMWHALGAVKKFGLQSLGTKEGRDESVSRAMRMHKNYDYIIAPSKATMKFYEEAFGYDESVFEILSLPRVDAIVNNRSTESFYRENPEMADEKVVLYLPTFRENESYAVGALMSEFDDGMDGYRLIVKTHPLFSKVKDKERYSFSGDFDTYDLMKSADIIVTDYSACAFEASLLMKPLYFFTPDYEKYERERGINIDLRSEMPSAVFDEADALCNAIKNEEYDIPMLYSFKNKYIENSGGDNAEKLAGFIIGLM